MKQIELKKIALGAILAALSVVLNLMFSLWLPTDAFGFPFYSIPLILAGLFLGPLYGLIVAVVADTAFGLAQGYYPLFVISSIAWGLLPRLMTRKPLGIKWYIIILITYIVSSLGNTFAIYVHFSKAAALGTLSIRLALLPVFAVLIAFVTKILYDRIYVALPDLIMNKDVKHEN